MKAATLIFTTALLSGCAMQTLEKALPQFEGKKIDYAINYLGYPDQELDVADKKVYVWSHQSTGSMPITTSKPTYNTTYGAFGPITTYGTTSETNYVPVSRECKIKLITDKKHKVLSTEFEGNESGCNRYADRLEGLVEKDKSVF